MGAQKVGQSICSFGWRILGHYCFSGQHLVDVQAGILASEMFTKISPGYCKFVIFGQIVDWNCYRICWDDRELQIKLWPYLGKSVYMGHPCIVQSPVSADGRYQLVQAFADTLPYLLKLVSSTFFWLSSWGCCPPSCSTAAPSWSPPCCWSNLSLVFSLHIWKLYVGGSFKLFSSKLGAARFLRVGCHFS